MAIVEMSLHNVSRISTETRIVKEGEGGYTVRDVFIHYSDNHDKGQVLRLTLYGLHSLQGAMSIPVEGK